MTRPVMFRRFCVFCALVLAVLGATVTPASASHFKYGTITWEKLAAPAGKYKVRITMETGWRWTYSWGIYTIPVNGTPRCPANLVPDSSSSCPVVNTVVEIGGGAEAQLTFDKAATVTIIEGYGAGQTVQATQVATTQWYVPASARVSSTIPDLDVMFARTVIEVTYNISSSPLTFEFRNSARLSTLLNGNNDRDYALRAVIDANPPNTHSAVSSSLPELFVTRGQANSILIPVATFDGTTPKLRFSRDLATGGVTNESGLFNGIPVGMTIDTAIPNLVKWTPAANALIGKHAVQFMLQSVSPTGQVKSEVPLDVLVNVEAACSGCPAVTVTTEAPEVQATVGQPFTTHVDVTASPFSAGSSLSLANTPFPDGMTMALSSPTVTPRTGTITWTPTGDSPENNVVCFQGGYTPPNSTTLLSRSAMTCLTIKVFNPFDLAPVVTCSATPVTMPVGTTPSAVVPISVTVAEPETQATTVTFTEGSAVLATSTTAAGVASAAVPLTRSYSLGTHNVVATAFDGEHFGSCTTTIIVTKKAQTISFSSPAAAGPLSVGSVTPLVATASSGLTPVTFSLAAGSKGSLTGNMLTVTGVGTVEIVAAQAGNGLWDAVTAALILDTVDTTPPDFTAPGDLTAEASSAAGAAVTFTTPTATDNVDGTVGVTCAPASGTTFALGAATVTCSASDAAANTTTKTFTITVRDTTAPSIAAHGDVTVEASSAAGALAQYDAPATHDLVDGDATAACSPAAGTQFAKGATLVTCTATDAAGNAATPATFTVVVVDTTPPVIEAHAAVAAEATSSAGATVTYSAPPTSDAVDGAATAACAPASGTLFALGSTTVTCHAADAAGNPAAATTFTVTVSDATGPAIAAHANVTQEASSSSGAVVTYDSPATADAVDGAGVATCAPLSGSTFPLGATTVTCTATDAAGNHAAETTFTVTVTDSVAPVIAAHGNESAEAASASGAAVTYDAPATSDAVGGAGTASCAPASGATFPIGTSTVVCSAADAAGNQAIATTFSVTVRDTTAPVIAAKADVFATATSSAGAIVNYAPPATSDAVDGAGTASCSPASGTQFAKGVTTVTCTATDAHGNHAVSTTFAVNVTNNAPSVSVPAAAMAEATGPSGAAVTFTATATDLEDGTLTPSCSPASGSTFAIGTTPVTCSVLDSAGAPASASFNVTVRDTTAPVVTYAGNTGPYNVAQTVSITCSAADAVGVVSNTCAPVSGPAYTFGLGSHTYSATATDAAGNEGSASTTFTVTVTPASLGQLVNAWVTNAGVASGLNAKLSAIASAPNASAKAGQVGAFINQVNGQIGKTITAAQAAILIQMVQAL